MWSTALWRWSAVLRSTCLGRLFLARLQQEVIEERHGSHHTRFPPGAACGPSNKRANHFKLWDLCDRGSHFVLESNILAIYFFAFYLAGHRDWWEHSEGTSPFVTDRLRPYPLPQGELSGLITVWMNKNKVWETWEMEGIDWTMNYASRHCRKAFKAQRW